jgi:lipid II:glycine glycyltransferase (peptidoglycan interpeptide bridge formation enzyme)
MYQLASDQVKDWNQYLLEFPEAHILQTLQWAEAKKQNGWGPMFFWSGSSRHNLGALVMVLRRQISFLGMKFTVLYAPKGPTLDWTDQAVVTQMLDFLQALSRKQKAIFIKIDPDVLLGTGFPGSEEEQPDPNGCRPTTGTEQARLAFLTRSNPIPQHGSGGLRQAKKNFWQP